jgi:hypothetical protein
MFFQVKVLVEEIQKKEEEATELFILTTNLEFREQIVNLRCIQSLLKTLMNSGITYKKLLKLIKEVEELKGSQESNEVYDFVMGQLAKINKRYPGAKRVS